MTDMTKEAQEFIRTEINGFNMHQDEESGQLDTDNVSDNENFEVPVDIRPLEDDSDEYGQENEFEFMPIQHKVRKPYVVTCPRCNCNVQTKVVPHCGTSAILIFASLFWFYCVGMWMGIFCF